MGTDWNPALTVADEPGKKAFFEDSIPVRFHPEIKVMDGYQLDEKMLDEVRRFVDLNLEPLLNYWYECIGVIELGHELRDLDGECISKGR